MEQAARTLVVVIASLAAAACAAVRSNITVTHALPASGAAKTVAIVPYDQGLASTPDFMDYAGRLAAHLGAKGYTVVPSGGVASDYVAFFHYGVDGEIPVNPFVSAPHPETGSLITYVLRTPYSVSARPFYRRTVIVEIVDRTRFRPNEPQSYLDARVYSGWVKSDGACATMAPVIDPMLMALFAEFPGESGAVRRIDLPADTACGPNRFG